jgi:hypothetical protein
MISISQMLNAMDSSTQQTATSGNEKKKTTFFSNLLLYILGNLPAENLCVSGLLSSGSVRI